MTARAMTMDPNTPDPSWLQSLGSNGGTLGIIVASLVGGVLWLRRFLSSDNVTNAANAAQTDLINMLRDQIDKERARADKAEQARDTAMTQIAQLQVQIEQLKSEVILLQKQVGAKTS